MVQELGEECVCLETSILLLVWVQVLHDVPSFFLVANLVGKQPRQRTAAGVSPKCCPSSPFQLNYYIPSQTSPRPSSYSSCSDVPSPKFDTHRPLAGSPWPLGKHSPRSPWPHSASQLILEWESDTRTPRSAIASTKNRYSLSGGAVDTSTSTISRRGQYIRPPGPGKQRAVMSRSTTDQISTCPSCRCTKFGGRRSKRSLGAASRKATSSRTASLDSRAWIMGGP